MAIASVTKKTPFDQLPAPWDEGWRLDNVSFDGQMWTIAIRRPDGLTISSTGFPLSHLCSGIAERLGFKEWFGGELRKAIRESMGNL